MCDEMDESNSHATLPKEPDRGATQSEPDSNMLKSWSEERLQAIAKRWKLSDEEQSKLKQLQPLLADIRHKKNDPEEVVRFLKEAHSIKGTELMFRKFIDFRIRQVDTILQDYQPHPVMKSHFPITILNGTDKDGDCIWLERTGVTDVYGLYKYFGKAGIMRYQLWAREKAMHTPWSQAYKAEKDQSPRVICILDMQGLNSSHMNPVLLPILADVVNIIQNYYCGFIKKIIVIREPPIFKVLWSLVKHFFNQSMKELIEFSGSNNYLAVLGKYIDDLEETLPPCLLEGARGTIAEGMPQRMDGGPVPMRPKPRHVLNNASESDTNAVQLQRAILHGSEGFHRDQMQRHCVRILLKGRHKHEANTGTHGGFKCRRNRTRSSSINPAISKDQQHHHDNPQDAYI
eukprot:Sro1058_g236350.1 SEC14-like protein 5 (402) ;mRNA; r:7427-8739